MRHLAAVDQKLELGRCRTDSGVRSARSRAVQSARAMPTGISLTGHLWVAAVTALAFAASAGGEEPCGG
jgi:hypothetical protein